MARYIRDLFTKKYRWTDDEGGIVMRFGAPPEKRKGLQVIPDIEPFVSPVSGEVIGGRRQRRDHMRAHELIEVGNEKIRPRKPEPVPPAGPDVKLALQRAGLMD
jgi:hypothetical protein